jgi:hypothetical protein
MTDHLAGLKNRRGGEIEQRAVQYASCRVFLKHPADFGVQGWVGGALPAKERFDIAFRRQAECALRYLERKLPPIGSHSW